MDSEGIRRNKVLDLSSEFAKIVAGNDYEKAVAGAVSDRDDSYMAGGDVRFSLIRKTSRRRFNESSLAVTS